MKVLFVAPHLCGRAYHEAAALKAAGVRVYLLELERDRMPWDRSVFAEERTADLATNVRALLDRAFASLIVDKIREAAKEWGVDVIHTHNEPDAFGAWVRKLRFPHVHDFHDIVTAELPWWVQGDAARWVVAGVQRRWERLAMQAGRTLAVSEEMADYYYSRWRVRPTPVHNGPARPAPAPRRAKIVYAGTLTPRRNTEAAIQRLAVDNEVHVYPVGPQRARLPGVIYHRPVPPEDVAGELRKYDWGLIWFQNPDTPNHYAACPNKYHDYRAAGLRVITNAKGHLRRHLLSEPGAGLAVDSLEDLEEGTLTGGPEGVDAKVLLKVYREVLR
jgi:glycosyltransferase involved in cell wall biosynthesis